MINAIFLKITNNLGSKTHNRHLWPQLPKGIFTDTSESFYKNEGNEDQLNIKNYHDYTAVIIIKSILLVLPLFINLI